MEPKDYTPQDDYLLVQGTPGNAVEGRYRKFQPLELDPEKQLAEVKAEASRMAREFGTAVTVWRYVTTASVRIPLPEVFFPDDKPEPNPLSGHLLADAE